MGPMLVSKPLTIIPQRKRGGGIAEGNPDDVERNINDERVDVTEETNAVSEGGDDDAGSKGSVSIDDHVYPNQRNLLAKEDDQITQKIKDIMKYIDPDQPDPFDPANLCKDNMQFIEKTKPCTEEQPPQILTKIDLVCILMLSGCRLSMFYIITKWVKHYSWKKKPGNLWIGYGIESR